MITGGPIEPAAKHVVPSFANDKEIHTERVNLHVTENTKSANYFNSREKKSLISTNAMKSKTNFAYILIRIMLNFMKRMTIIQMLLITMKNNMKQGIHQGCMFHVFGCKSIQQSKDEAGLF